MKTTHTKWTKNDEIELMRQFESVKIRGDIKEIALYAAQKFNRTKKAVIVKYNKLLKREHKLQP